VLALLQTMHVSLVVVDRLHVPENIHLTQPNWRIAYNKLHAWRLTQYERVIFLDLDQMVLRNLDHLAVWPDANVSLIASGDYTLAACNLTVPTLLSAVLVLRPRQDHFKNLVSMMRFHRLPNGTEIWPWHTDQEMIAEYFHSDYELLPMQYMWFPTECYCTETAHGPARPFSDVYLVHFTWGIKEVWLPNKAATRKYNVCLQEVYHLYQFFTSVAWFWLDRTESG